MSQIETVKVELPDGDYTIINKSDFDPSRHTLFSEEKDVATQPSVAPVGTARTRRQRADSK
ncbi:MAG TPA: hypothetical protein VGB17_06915 [Pyrinomonadaceae bacterium]|jgi:hypothetical protein